MCNGISRERGQGLVEYALILSLVSLVVIVILSVAGIRIGSAFEEIYCNLDTREYGFSPGKIMSEPVDEGETDDYKCVFYNLYDDGSYVKGGSWNVWDSDGDGR